MSEAIERGGQAYTLKKIPPLKQFHIARRMAPLLPKLAVLFANFKKSGPQVIADIKDGNMPEALGAIDPITQIVATMSDADAEFILYGLLEGVSRMIPGGGSSGVVVNGNLMYADIPMPTLMELAGRAFWFNLAPFLPVVDLPSNLGNQTAPSL